MDDKFIVKPVSERNELVNDATHKILYIDYRILKGDGSVDVLPSFSMQVFQLRNKKAINKISYNDSNRTIMVSYIDQNIFVSIKQIDKQISRNDEGEFCTKLEEALNEILKLPE